MLVINGPNLRLLDSLDPMEGVATLNLIRDRLHRERRKLENEYEIIIDLDFRQSNHEGEIVTWLEEALRDGGDGRTPFFQGVIINPAALAYTSQVLADAQAVVEQHLMLVEVHLHERTELTRRTGSLHIAGWGMDGYVMALQRLVTHCVEAARETHRTGKLRARADATPDAILET